MKTDPTEDLYANINFLRHKVRYRDETIEEQRRTIALQAETIAYMETKIRQLQAELARAQGPIDPQLLYQMLQQAFAKQISRQSRFDNPVSQNEIAAMFDNPGSYEGQAQENSAPEKSPFL